MLLYISSHNQFFISIEQYRSLSLCLSLSAWIIRFEHRVEKRIFQECHILDSNDALHIFFSSDKANNDERKRR